jgi:hypothetical protein
MPRLVVKTNWRVQIKQIVFNAVDRNSSIEVEVRYAVIIISHLFLIFLLGEVLFTQRVSDASQTYQWGEKKTFNVAFAFFVFWI